MCESTQLGTREIRAGTTFMTWNHLTLDVMQRHSRDYYSPSSLGLHHYYASQHGKVQLRNGTIQFPTPRPYVTTSVTGKREHSGVQTGGGV